MELGEVGGMYLAILTSTNCAVFVSISYRPFV